MSIERLSNAQAALLAAVEAANEGESEYTTKRRADIFLKWLNENE